MSFFHVPRCLLLLGVTITRIHVTTRPVDENPRISEGFNHSLCVFSLSSRFPVQPRDVTTFPVLPVSPESPFPQISLHVNVVSCEATLSVFEPKTHHHDHATRSRISRTLRPGFTSVTAVVHRQNDRSVPKPTRRETCHGSSRSLPV